MARCIDCGLLWSRRHDGTLLEADDEFRTRFWPGHPLCAERRYDLSGEMIDAWHARTGETGEPETFIAYFPGDDRPPKRPKPEDLKLVLERVRRCPSHTDWIRGLHPADAIRRRDARSSDRFARALGSVSLLIALAALMRAFWP